MQVMKKILFIVCFILLSCSVIGQVGTSAGSFSYVRNSMSNGSAGYMYLPKAETIFVEDFINYHRHKIETPTTQDVALSIDYDNNTLEGEDRFIMQVGIATRQADGCNRQRDKVNVSLVLDISSSMRGQKIEALREAASNFVKALNDGDKLSIVTFNGTAEVVLPATHVTAKRKKIYDIIDRLEASGYTNINDGMMLGYKEAAKFHSDEISSRVILLTDGQTNRGETDPQRIADNSLEYNQDGIEISTIGVGNSLDFNLLRVLADRGRGSNYFIGEDKADLEKVFKEELDALFYNIGRSSVLRVDLPKGWIIEKCYGYNPVFDGSNSMSIDLSNLGMGSTRVVLLEVKRCFGTDNGLQASIEYMKNGNKGLIEKKMAYKANECDPNSEVVKNYTIACLAQGLKDAAIAGEDRPSEAPGSMLEKSLKEVLAMDKGLCTEDEDVKRVYDVVKGYVPGGKVVQVPPRPRVIY